MLKARVDGQEDTTTRVFRSIGESEPLGEDLLTMLGCQGLELTRLEESSCRCNPSGMGSYFTPGIAEEERSVSSRGSPAYSMEAVGTPSGSRALSVSSDGVPEPPAENALALRVPVCCFCNRPFLD